MCLVNQAFAKCLLDTSVMLNILVDFWTCTESFAHSLVTHRKICLHTESSRVRDYLYNTIFIYVDYLGKAQGLKDELLIYTIAMASRA